MSIISIKIVTGKDIMNPLTSFSGVIGQQAVVNKLAFFLASHTPNSAMPTFLFCGSHGLGKTYIAKKFAENMHRRYVEINASSIEKTKDFVEQIVLGEIMGDTPVTILIDEAHAINNEIETMLLSVLAPTKEGKTYINYNQCTFEFDMSRINFILATTDTYKISSPLINRTQTIYFDTYNKQELLDMVNMYLPHITLDCDTKKLTDACRGRGRDAFMLAQNIIRYCRINDKKVFSHEDLNCIEELFQIYPEGLTKQEFEVLKTISENEPIALSSLAMSLMIAEENVETELEVRLRELRLITNTPRGRVLTEAGKKYYNRHIKDFSL